MSAEFLTPNEAVEAGLSRSKAHRLKESLSNSLQGNLLIVDGEPITSQDALGRLLRGLASRAETAETDLTAVREKLAAATDELAAAKRRAERLSEELLQARLEAEMLRDRATAIAPALAALVSQASRILDDSLNPPESKFDR